MRTIFIKEFTQFFSSITGYITLFVFLILMGLLTFVFPETSIFSYNYATMDSFFDAAPYALLFLIPALTMALFAEEKVNQTLELLFTKPISIVKIIGGKYLASLVLLLLAILPTFGYVFILSKLSEPVNNLDYGGIWGSYVGLFLLGAAFCAIGIFASSLSKNQIVAFLLSLFLCFAMYFVFTSISQIPWVYGKADYLIQQLGMESHYNSLSRGVIDSVSICYFLTVIAIFLWLTFVSLQLNRS